MRTGPAITGDDGAGFHEAGYLVVTGALSQDLVAQARDGGRDGDLDAAAFSPALRAAAAEVLGDEALPLSVVRFACSPGRSPPPGSAPLNPHTHDRELVTDPPGRFVLAWAALKDVMPEDGSMWIAPGGHRRPTPLQTLVHDRLEQAQPGENARIAAALAVGVDEADLIGLLVAHHDSLRAVLEDEAATPCPLLLRAGDAILFHPALTHGSMPPAPSPEPRPRLSLLFRYAGASARLFAGSLGAREPRPDPARRLQDRRRRTAWGEAFDGYGRERLRWFGVRPA